MGAILLVSASFGGGHDAAAHRFAQRLADLGYEPRVIDLLDLLPAGLGHALRRGYRTQLSVAPFSWTWVCQVAGMSGTAGLGGAQVQATTTWLADILARRLQEFVTPDTAAVVSTYPLASQTLGRLRECGMLSVPAVTVLTDMAVHPMWVARGIDAHLALHRVAAGAARRLGARNVTVGGPIVPGEFRSRSAGGQRAARRNFGLPEEGPLALVVTGSWGVGQSARTALDIARTGLATPVVACGRNRTGRARLLAAGIGKPLGWVDDMPALFHACDVVVQSGGGLSTQEALVSGRAVLTYRCLPGHGLANAAALHEAGWAPWIRTRAELGPALAAALAQPPPRLPHNDPAALIAQIADLRTARPRRRRARAAALDTTAPALTRS